MVCFIPAGRAGNFFFTCATSFAYAKMHNLEFSVPEKTSSDYWSPIYLKHLQNQNYDSSLPTVTIKEKHFHFAPLPFNEEWKNYNIILSGYFQSPLYFQDYRKEILEAFKIPYEIKPQVCSVHARYGDYLTIAGKHIVMNEPYLVEAMEIINDKTGITKFKVFSDDIPLFKQRHGHLYDFEYSTNINEMDDLTEMSCCHSSINSSSTFSWWSAWLNQNQNKVIITPRSWFQNNWDGANTSDLVPSEWIKI